MEPWSYVRVFCLLPSWPVDSFLDLVSVN